MARSARSAIREVHVSIGGNTKFDDLVKQLREALVVPRVRGIGGCDPCLSGLDKFVVNNEQTAGR